MQQEVGFEVAMQRVDELFVVTGAQRGHNQALCFTTGEQSRTVGPWQQTSFRNDRTDFIQRTTVNTTTVFDNVTAQNNRFQLFDCGTKVRIFKLFFGQTGKNGVFGCRHGGNTLLLVGVGISGAHAFFASGFDNFVKLGIIRRFEFKRLLGGIFGQINDQVDYRLDLLVGENNSPQHLFFGQLVSFGFNHHHGVFGACNNKVETLLGVVAQLIHILNRWVQNVFAILKANTGTSDWATEWCARDGQSSRGRDHRNNVRVVDKVVAQNSTHDQNFVFEARHKQRADRTVDQARGQCFFFGWACFTLEKTAWDFTGGVVFLLVVNGQREKILTRLLLAGKCHVRHDAGFAQSRDHGTVCLTGNLAGFQCERFFAPLHGFFGFFEHHRILSGSTPGPPGLPFA